MAQPKTVSKGTPFAVEVNGRSVTITTPDWTAHIFIDRQDNPRTFTGKIVSSGGFERDISNDQLWRLHFVQLLHAHTSLASEAALNILEPDRHFIKAKEKMAGA